MPFISEEFKKDNFYIKLYNENNLAENSYYVESSNEAIIIDILRDVDHYI